MRLFFILILIFSNLLVTGQIDLKKIATHQWDDYAGETIWWVRHPL